MLIIHGDNQVASREFLLATKQTLVKKDLDVISLEGSELVLSDLLQYINSSNLLGKTNAVVIEGFFARRPSNDKKKIVEYLEKDSSEEIIFWDAKDLGMQLKNFSPTVIKKFELPKTIFKYLGSLSMPDLTLTLENTAAELVFSLLIGQVRKLIMVKDGIVSLSSWQLAKLKSQVAKFSLEKLKAMHHELLEIDYKNKTSASGMSLTTALEVWTFKNHNIS